MSDLNKFVFSGRLGGDPEVKYTQAGDAVATFSVAQNGWKSADGTQQTNWWKVKAWRQKAEFVQKFLFTGSFVVIEGQINQREFEGQDGEIVKFYEVTADNIHLGPRVDGQGGGGGNGGNYNDGEDDGGYDNAPRQRQGGGGGTRTGTRNNGVRYNNPNNYGNSGNNSNQGGGGRPAGNRQGNAPARGQGAQGQPSRSGNASGGNRPAQRPGAAQAQANRAQSRQAAPPAPEVYEEPDVMDDNFEDDDPFADQ